MDPLQQRADHGVFGRRTAEGLQEEAVEVSFDVFGPARAVDGFVELQ
jgi:hypothetical protein